MLVYCSIVTDVSYFIWLILGGDLLDYSKLSKVWLHVNNIKWYKTYYPVNFYRLDCESFYFQDNPLENLNLAFEIAEKHLDIPKMLGRY